MTPLSLLGIYESKYDDHIYESRKRRLERRKIGRRVAIFIVAVVLTVSWLTMRFRHFMKRSGETGIDDTFNIDLGEAKYWQRMLASSSASCEKADKVRFTVLLSYHMLGSHW